jgi:hypothetical protein
MTWDEVEERKLEDQKTAKADRMVLSVLAQENQEVRRWHPVAKKWLTYDFSEQITWIRDYRFISKVLQSTLREPRQDKDTGQYLRDEAGHYVVPAGLLSSVCDDGRVRTHFYLTKETFRWSSARPPMQNFAKRREHDYRRILGPLYKEALRSMIMASPGYVLMEADWAGAELGGMAFMSGDQAMIEHARRNALPESHPDHYDIHSNVAVLAFGLRCSPTKAGLESIDAKHLRVVAKSVVFGIAYGRGAKAIALAAKEEGIRITVDEAQRVVDTIFRLYPRLGPFFDECRERSRDPRWLQNCFGLYRRFPVPFDRTTANNFEREAMNFPIQSLVAAMADRACDFLMRERARRRLNFRLVLQIHDAIIFEVPYALVPTMVDEVIPSCMVEQIPICPTRLDGAPLSRGPYHLGVDVEPFLYWGEGMTPDQCLQRGFDPRYAKWTWDDELEGYVHPEKEQIVWRGDVNGGELLKLAL